MVLKYFVHAKDSDEMAKVTFKIPCFRRRYGTITPLAYHTPDAYHTMQCGGTLDGDPAF